MNVVNEKCEVIRNERVSSDGHVLVLNSRDISRQTLPGQFVEIGCYGEDMILRRPFSVFDVSSESLSLFIKIIGKGTKWLSELNSGSIVDLIGPLGNGFTVSSNTRSLLIGGGCGIASLNLLSRRLFYSDCNTDTIFGFSKPEEIPREIIEGFQKRANRVLVTVDKGPYPIIGNVVDTLKEIDLENYDRFYCCGPTRMLKALEPFLYKREVEVSLEAHMACGIGVCYGCTINTKHGSKRVCLDGPVFKMEEVEWNEM
ncbi:hypothetical protein V512_013385 [Mesotoga sp. Brook.08.105.5.1]|uniref:dihydroorotate dehydrogenase electron transfer subunit n=1 Tax=Mesotoga sp. Brook.08.105.5.1 TaxID=1421002 RepID=UPI000C19C10B|nr:dihydroorotate dehydrogenase electron transfer subunit [Mesotoga sp. Brook.08.105.5.1]PVD17877.1 hypothetical protein V512_013385 [Mesotoga sp. Brook.08.105.5.1]